MTARPDMDTASALHDPMPGMFIPRELWQPDVQEQLAACETVLAEPVASEARKHTVDRLAIWAAEDYRAQAVEHRRYARVQLRWGNRHGHRQWMHDAVRAWRNFKYWHRRAVQ